MSDGRLPKSSAFQLGDESGRLSSAGCEFVGWCVGYREFVPQWLKPQDETDFGTSELEPITRRRVDEPIKTRVYGAGEWRFPTSSGTATQQGVSRGRSKHSPSNSARTLLEECFADNPSTHLDTNQQVTGIVSDQLIQFAGAVGLEVSSATFWNVGRCAVEDWWKGWKEWW